MKMMKNIALLFAFASLTSGINLSGMEAMQPQLGSPNIFGLATPVAPNNTKLVWDLDDVVLEKHMKWVVASYLASVWWIPTMRRTDLLQKELKKLIGSGAGAEGIVAFAKAKGDDAVAKFVSDIANTKTINPSVATIMKDVSARGIKEYIASNMGQEGYAHIMQGTTPADIEIAKVFNAYISGTPQLVDYSQIPELAKNPEAKIVILKKPNPKFFHEFFRKNHIDPKTARSVFIDDKEDNVKAFIEAAGENATGIVYKDAGQLRSDLEALQILVNQNTEALQYLTE
jgi:hypothetical protein